MNTSEKAEHNALIRHIERFSKSRMPIYNFEVLDMAGRKNTDNYKKLCVLGKYSKSFFLVCVKSQLKSEIKTKL